MGNKNLVEMLFDLSFSEFITTRVIKILFIIGVGVAAIGTLMIVVGAFSGGFGRGLLALLLSPILFLIYTLFARIWCEMVIVVFRIAENTSRMVAAKQPPAAE